MGSEKDILFRYIQNMPKVELHAHLGGSISHKTLQKLIEFKASMDLNFKREEFVIPEFTGDLDQFFQLFNVINKVTDSSYAVYMATEDVIEEFYNDGVRYLELRTTPKENAETGLTQESYVRAVLEAITTTCEGKCMGMTVKLLLSIDRSKPVEYAEKTLQVAESFLDTDDNVVGIDLCGDPTKGNIKDFLPVLNFAKDLGLRLSVHIAEIAGKPEEVEQLLKLRPDRLGHGTYLHPERGGCCINFERVKAWKIPLEICLTSNVLCKTVKSYEDHHFKLLKEMGYPCTLCTDDKAVYKTTLSEEYFLATQYYSLSKSDLFKMSFESIEYAFCSKKEKEKLRKNWLVFILSRE